MDHPPFPPGGFQILTAQLVGFVGAIGTIALLIAAPFVRYAVAIPAAKLVRRASGLCKKARKVGLNHDQELLQRNK